jgi:hypothetical protein
MKSIKITLIFVALFASTAHAGEIGWQDDYIKALVNFENRDFVIAADALESAIAQNPQPQTGGIDYLPYIHLAVARFELGENVAARNALVQSHVMGTAPLTNTGLAMMDLYAERIMIASLEQPGPPPDNSPSKLAIAEEQPVVQVETAVQTQASHPEVEVVPVTTNELAMESQSSGLTENEVQSIRDKVLTDCETCSDGGDQWLPWYFHYQMGVDLMAAGDDRRALNAFITGAKLREESSRDSRMYGMWYVDYLPYYQIARVHTRLGNWENARDAIRVSDSLGEFSPLDQGYEEYTTLQNLIASHVDESGP